MQDSLAGRTRLDAAECLNAFNVDFVSAYSDVFVVLDYTNSSQLVAWNFDVNGKVEGDSCNWICSDYDFCGKGECVPSAAEDWRVNIDDPIRPPNPGRIVGVSYCLAEEMDSQCTVVVGTYLLAVVILCNAVKVACLAYLALRGRRGFTPLITVGDAVASFLAVEDATTVGEGALSSAGVKGWARRRKGASHGASTSHRPNLSWRSERHFWFRSASPWRWTICFILCVDTSFSPFAFKSILRFVNDADYLCTAACLPS